MVEMANKDMQEQSFELYFPLGINEAVAYSHQPSLTSPIIQNVRLRDIFEGRARGGQRPGMSKIFETQAGTDRPILKIVNIVNTFIPAEE